MENLNEIKNEVDNIQIFTNEFLEHNKSREQELRNLKKMTTDAEESNAMLEKHINNINLTIEQLGNEIKQKKASNAVLYKHLGEIRNVLLNEFCDSPNTSTWCWPGTNESPKSKDEIDNYLHELQSKYKLNSNSKEMEIVKRRQ